MALPHSLSSAPTAFTHKPAHFSFPPSLHTNNPGNQFFALLSSSKSGQAPLASQYGGSRITAYAVTKVVEEDGKNIISISAMPVYGGKTHEELRWEDHQLSTKGTANPLSTSLFSSKQGQPPLANQHGGSGITPYPLTKMVDEDSAKLVSISAMSVFGVKSCEELRWEDYQLRTEGGNDALNMKSERPSPFSVPSPSSPFQFSPLPNANMAPTIPPIFQPSTCTLLSMPTNLIPGDSRIQQSPTNSNPTWKPLTNTSSAVPSSSPAQNLNGNPCTACGCIKTNPFTIQSQETSESSQTESAAPAVAEPPTMADNIVPVKDPFGVQSSKSQLADHAASASFSRMGISSMPQVVDKPASSRIFFLLPASARNLRHVSQRQTTSPFKNWQPKSNATKVPFFIREDSEGIPRPVNHPIPRENPKSAFTINVAEPTDDTFIGKLFQLKVESTYPTENSQVQGSCDDDDDNEIVCDQLEEVVPKLTRSDYYTEPLISELETKERMDPGFCGRVSGFVIGRHGYGKIEFEGETDIRGLDLDSLVEFNTREVAVYKDESKKVAVGEGLNKPALVTLLNVKCMNKKTGEVYVDGDQVAKYEQMLRAAAQKQGAEFVSYDPVKGEWKFHVHHF